MKPTFREILFVILVTVVANGAGFFIYSQFTHKCNAVIEGLEKEASNLKEKVKSLAEQVEKLEVDNAFLRDHIKWLTEKNTTLEKENKELKRLLAKGKPEKVNPVALSCGPSAPEDVVIEKQLQRSLKGSFLLSFGAGYGTTGVKLRVEGSTVYGDPKYNFFPVLGVNYFFEDHQAVGVQVQGNEAVIFNYSISTDAFGLR